MLRELAHFARHAPNTLRLSKKLPQAVLYQTLMQRGESLGMADRRARLVGDLRDDVLEIGCGTGLMFSHYPKGVRLTAIEPDAEFLSHAHGVLREAPAGTRAQVASGEHLPFGDGSFDAVVSALVLCSVRSVDDVLAEVRRVLRSGGQLRLIEHVRSHRPIAGALMDLVDPLWLRANKQGCHMNRRIESSLVGGGFELLEVDRFQIYTPGLPAFPMRWIRAAVR